MHVARARHVINIRYRNSRLNSVNRRVFFSVIRDYYSCYLKLRVEQLENMLQYLKVKWDCDARTIAEEEKD